MSKYVLKLALPLAVLSACGGDDDSNDTTAADTSTGTPATESGSETNNPETSVTTTVTETTDATTGVDTGPADTTAADSESTGAPGDVARIRVMHLGVGAPAVDVFANGEGPVFEALEFRNSTDYAEVPAGD